MSTVTNANPGSAERQAPPGTGRQAVSSRQGGGCAPDPTSEGGRHNKGPVARSATGPFNYLSRARTRTLLIQYAAEQEQGVTDGQRRSSDPHPMTRQTRAWPPLTFDLRVALAVGQPRRGAHAWKSCSCHGRCPDQRWHSTCRHESRSERDATTNYRSRPSAAARSA